MKVVILAGGLGTRLSEETTDKPKPMVEIGGKPMLWHIMKIYSEAGFNEFVICLGYKGYVVKEFFANYFLHQSDVTIHLGKNQIITHQSQAEPWEITLLDTGVHTMTGGRIKRVASYLQGSTFLLTYGDGLGDIPIRETIDFHKNHGKLLTVTSVRPSGRFGALQLDDNQAVRSFAEKPQNEQPWINGGFFVCEPEILDFIDDDTTIFERAPMERLAEQNQMMAYLHYGFWMCMDTLRDKNELEKLWHQPNTPWETWNS